jgi:large subunit ribosomal protein L31e
MAVERTYTVPLRPGFRNAPKYYRTNKAMSTLRAFLVRHMKVAEEHIRIGQHLNAYIWENGIKNPPPRVTIHVKKADDGVVTAELEGKTFADAVKPQAREEQPQGLREKLQAAVGKKEDKPEEAPAEAPKKRAAKKTAESAEE